MIPLCTPDIRGKEQEYVADAISTGYLCDGPYLERFADALCEWTGRKHCVLTSSGTAALHTALVVADESMVRIPNWTFVATANAAKLANYRVVLADEGLYPSQFGVHVDVLGRESPIDSPLVMDSAQSIGDKDMFFTDIPQAVSFNANKLICAAGGGALFYTEEDRAETAQDFISQARIPGAYNHRFPATNYRMSNVQAAIGLAQMETIAERIEKKLRIWRVYAKAGIPMFGEPSTFLSVMGHPDAMSIGEKLRSRGISAQSLWMPLHLTAAYADAERRVNGDAERKWQTTLALPCSTWMEIETVEAVARKVVEAIG